MSSPDSFLTEVADEVRRDRLMLYARRYGWIVALAIVLIVGGAAAWEWQKARKAAEAEAFGDDLVAALQSPDASVRALALSEIAAEGEAATIRDLLAAGEESQADSRRASEMLQAIVDNPDARPAYRDIARLRLLQLPENTLTTDQRLEIVEPLLVAGGAFRLTALELRALIHVERNETDLALGDLSDLLNDAAANRAQRQRAMQLATALGGDPEAL